MRLLANENFPLDAVIVLREAGHDVAWIREDSRGVSDDAVLRRAQEENRIAIIASADLSHKLSKDSPSGFDPEGPKFDQTIQDAIVSRDMTKLLSIDQTQLEKSAQCGYRPIVTLLGALDGMNVNVKVLAYEAPFGVGYLTVRFDIP